MDIDIVLVVAKLFLNNVTYSRNHDMKSSSTLGIVNPRDTAPTLGSRSTREVKSEAPAELHSGTSRY